MKSREVNQRIEALGGYFVRQRGSHRRFAAKYADAEGIERTAFTSVQLHKGQEIPNGTLRAIHSGYDRSIRRRVVTRMNYTALVTREDDNWLGEVEELAGAHAYAKTLTRLREELADAIILAADLPDDARVHVSFVADDVDPVVAKAFAVAEMRRKLAEQEAEIHAKTTAAVHELVSAGWSVRDSAGALDITPGRVSQLANC